MITLAWAVERWTVVSIFCADSPGFFLALFFSPIFTFSSTLTIVMLSGLAVLKKNLVVYIPCWIFGCKIVLCKRHDSSSTAALHELVTNDSQLEKKLHTAQCMFHCLSSKAPSYLTWLSFNPLSTKDEFSRRKTHVNNYERWVFLSWRRGLL